MAAQSPFRTSAHKSKNISKPTTQKFNIEKVPFYKAVILFQAERYQEAFDIFVLLYKAGNLCAPFYLQYMIKNQKDIVIKMEDRSLLDMKTLDEHIGIIPDRYHPEFWCQASLCIIKCEKAKSNEVNDLIEKLHTLSQHASNAVVYLFDFYMKNMRPEVLQAMITMTITSDLWCLSKICDYGGTQEYILKEKKMLEEFASIAYELTGAGTLAQKLSDCNSHRRLAWFKTGAHLGNADLQLAFYQDASNTDNEERVKWLKVAAFHDILGACLLGNAYYKGDALIPKKMAAVRPCLEKIFLIPGRMPLSERGRVFYEKTFELLSGMYERGEGGCEPQSENARKFYQRSAELGYLKGHLYFAMCCQNGIGGAPGYALAIQHYEQAIAKNTNKTGIAMLQFNITMLQLRGGFGIKKSEKLAFENFAKAAPHYSVAQTYYAVMLYYGAGLDKPNKEAAIPLCIRAAEQDDAKCAYVVCKEYMDGNLDLSKFQLSLEKIEKFLIITTRAYPQTLPLLAKFYLKDVAKAPDYTKAHPVLLEGARLHQPLCFYLLAWIYEEGCEALGIAADKKTAYEYACFATEGDNPVNVAISAKGRMLMRGDGVAQDIKSAKKCLRKALGLGVKGAACDLFLIFADSKFTQRPNYEYAIQYLAQADQQDVDVIFNWGICYLKGFGKDKDRKLAIEKFEAAGNLGDAKSVCMFAFLKLFEMLAQNQYDRNVLQDIVSKLRVVLSDVQTEVIRLFSMFSLLVEPSAEQLSSSIQMLEQSIKLTQDPQSQIFLDYLKNKDIPSLNCLEMIVRCLLKNPEIALEFGQVKETAEIQQPNEGRLDAVQTHEANRIDALKREIDWYLDPKNGKQLNFKRFAALVTEAEKMITLRDRQPLERTKKGFKHIVSQISVPQQQGEMPALFFMHATHGPGRNQGKEGLDPNRRRDMQDHLRAISASLARENQEDKTNAKPSK